MDVKPLDIDLTLKKNNIDELFFNLSESPKSFKNKDFRYTLSLIYQTFEDEFEGVFLSPNSPVRNTDFYLIEENGALSFFVTPTNNFQFYLKSKGSMFRFSPKIVEGKQGYVMPLDLILDYFGGFGEIVDLSAVTPSFVYFNKLTQFTMKLIEKLYFIPTIYGKGNTFKVIYEPIISNPQISKIIGQFENNIYDGMFIKGKMPENFVLNFIRSYLNYLVYKFLNIKSYKFKDLDSGMYLIKDMEFKSIMRNNDLSESISDWLDELYLGKYDLIPFFKISKINDENFELKIHIKNKKTDETVLLDELYHQDKVFNINVSDVSKIIEKQLNYVVKYMPEIEKLFDDEDKLSLNLNLQEVYEIITKTLYYLQKAHIDVILPEELTNIVVPRASINARVKKDRLEELVNVFNNTKTGKVTLDELLDFKYEVNLGSTKISIEEYKKLLEHNNGLINYNGEYIFIDKKESQKMIEKLLSPEIMKMTRLELINTSMSKQLGEYEFDYDEKFASIIKDFNKTVEVDPPKELNGTLRVYQKTGLKWLWTNISKGFGCCMADDMGLGKTIQVISLILKLKEEDKLNAPVLVVCPTTLLGNWMKELEMFAPTLKAEIYHGYDRELNLKNDIILTTYAIMRIDTEKLKKENWAMVIVDEAQNIKNPDTAQTLAIKSVKSDIKIAMTGTPVENKLTELWSIFDFINHGYLGSLREFQKGYAIPIEKFKENSRAAKLKMSISPFVLRRVKTDKNVISDLPEKMVINDYCYLSKTQVALYEKTLNDMLGKISEMKGVSRRGNIFKMITILKQICNHPYQYLKKGDMTKDLSGKMEKCVDLVSQILENNEKTLIFTQYKEMGDILVNILNDELGIMPLFFHGSLNVRQREDMINDFQNTPDTKIMILSLKAGGTGLNLTSATNVIHYDLWWNPAVEDQATDRTYRIGQDKNVMVHRLITLGTFEEKIDEMLSAKKDLANMAVFEGEKIITELSDEEIYEIFTLSSGGVGSKL